MSIIILNIKYIIYLTQKNFLRAAYRSKKTSEVVRAYAVLTLCGVKPLVTHNATLMKLGQKILGKTLFGLIMKQSFYGHFVAGEDQEGIKPVIGRMHSFGVKSILDYSVEVDESEKKKEEKKSFNMKKVLKDILCLYSIGV